MSCVVRSLSCVVRGLSCVIRVRRKQSPVTIPSLEAQVFGPYLLPPKSIIRSKHLCPLEIGTLSWKHQMQGEELSTFGANVRHLEKTGLKPNLVQKMTFVSF